MTDEINPASLHQALERVKCYLAINTFDRGWSSAQWVRERERDKCFLQINKTCNRGERWWDKGRNKKHQRVFVSVRVYESTFVSAMATWTETNDENVISESTTSTQRLLFSLVGWVKTHLPVPHCDMCLRTVDTVDGQRHWCRCSGSLSRRKERKNERKKKELDDNTQQVTRGHLLMHSTWALCLESATSNQGNSEE